MFAEVANYANDAGMFDFLIVSCRFARLRVPRGSALPSETFALQCSVYKRWFPERLAA